MSGEQAGFDTLQRVDDQSDGTSVTMGRSTPAATAGADDNDPERETIASVTKLFTAADGLTKPSLAASETVNPSLWASAASAETDRASPVRRHDAGVSGAAEGRATSNEDVGERGQAVSRHHGVEEVPSRQGQPADQSDVLIDGRVRVVTATRDGREIHACATGRVRPVRP